MGHRILEGITIPIQPNALPNNQREVSGFLCGHLGPPKVPGISDVRAFPFVGCINFE